MERLTIVALKNVYALSTKVDFRRSDLLLRPSSLPHLTKTYKPDILSILPSLVSCFADSDSYRDMSVNHVSLSDFKFRGCTEENEAKRSPSCVCCAAFCFIQHCSFCPMHPTLENKSLKDAEVGALQIGRTCFSSSMPNSRRIEPRTVRWMMQNFNSSSVH